MSDRVLVMHEGKVGGIFDRADATQETIMRAATGNASVVEAAIQEAMEQSIDQAIEQVGGQVGEKLEA